MEGEILLPIPIHMDEIPSEIMEYVNRIVSIRYPRQGHTSHVAIIESDQGIFALKRTKGKLFNYMLHQEVSILNSLHETTQLPVPRVKKFIQQHQHAQYWALMDFIEGQTIRAALWNEHNNERRQEIIFQFGAILSTIHATPCPSEWMTNEQAWLDYMLNQATYNLNNDEVDGTAALLSKLIMNKPKQYKQTFIHGDYTIDNVIVSNGIITGVIDWSSGAYGDPRYDASLAIRPKPNAFIDKIDQQIFFEGYGERIINNDEYDYFANGLYEFF
ncbi:aminoglycoside phosphotransferase family protein [Paenibacillus campi]|uniref:phosphotransferase family protein n=1 Tax=Paenibacillus campi TaxID=3106031 RepID=UPI002AFF1C6E|nr:aminoglycoside phosphotransferase family protein [Paenibacillus sp. SGZ-1014]